MTLPELIEALENDGSPNFERERIITELTGYPNCYRQADGTIPLNATVPNFTASVEAAMALAIFALNDGDVDFEVAYRFVGGKPHGRAEICGPAVFGMAKSKTPAMALVLATLKAIQARGDA
jgi:hypothetical protein